MPPKIIFYIVCFFLITASYGFVYHKGVTSCELSQAKAVINGEIKHEKESIKIQRLPDSDLRRELCKWMRDSDLSGCLKSLAPFRP